MKRIIIFALLLCIGALALFSACSGDSEESSAGTVSRTPASPSKDSGVSESSKSDMSVPEISKPDFSVDISEIIPDTSDMFTDGSTVGDYSNGMLEDSDINSK